LKKWLNINYSNVATFKIAMPITAWHILCPGVCPPQTGSIWHIQQYSEVSYIVARWRWQEI